MIHTLASETGISSLHVERTRVSELFLGTGSVGSAFAFVGWGIVSLDPDPKTDATIHADILSWDFTAPPPGHFDTVRASPYCTHYCVARRGATFFLKFSLGELSGVPNT